MKLGVFMVLLSGRKLEDALDYVASKGLKAVEIGTGGYRVMHIATLQSCLKMKQH